MSSRKAVAGSTVVRPCSSGRRSARASGVTATSSRTVPRAATVLAEAGLEPGDRAILWAVNRPEWGIALLAIAHRGAVAVPLDVRHTVDFGRKIVEQTGARMVVATRQTEASARQLGLPIVFLETLPDRARRADPLPAAAIDATTLAEIVFTSGTTGEPKGAMLTHGNLIAVATAMTQVLPFDQRDRLLSVLPLSHLYEQVLGLIAPLIVGASIVYPVSRQPAVLIRTFRDYGVSVLLIVPQGLRLLDAAIERKVDQSGRRARSSSFTGSPGGRPARSAGCCSGRSSASSAGACTPSASEHRRSRWRSPSAGRKWGLTCCRATARRYGE